MTPADLPGTGGWSGRRESNPRLLLGRQGSYHYTTPAALFEVCEGHFGVKGRRISAFIARLTSNDREWRAFCERFLSLPDLSDDLRFARNVDRVANAREIDAMIAAEMLRFDREEAITALTAAGTASGRLSTMDDLARHPQARRATVGSPTGPAELMGAGVRTDGETVTALGPVPALGQHGAKIRAEFGRILEPARPLGRIG